MADACHQFLKIILMISSLLGIKVSAFRKGAIYTRVLEPPILVHQLHINRKNRQVDHLDGKVRSHLPLGDK